MGQHAVGAVSRLLTTWKGTAEHALLRRMRNGRDSASLHAAGECICETARVGNDDIMFEVGQLARAADGACVVSLGQTQVLATVWARTRDAWMRRDADRQLQASARHDIRHDILYMQI